MNIITIIKGRSNNIWQNKKNNYQNKYVWTESEHWRTMCRTFLCRMIGQHCRPIILVKKTNRIFFWRMIGLTVETNFGEKKPLETEKKCMLLPLHRWRKSEHWKQAERRKISCKTAENNQSTSRRIVTERNNSVKYRVRTWETRIPKAENNLTNQSNVFHLNVYDSYKTII